MFKKYIKEFYWLLKGKSLLLKKGINSESKWYGNEYGGFFVNPLKIDDKSIIYSIGIGEDVSFDLGLIREFNCSVYGFDPTPKSIIWVGAQNLPPNFHFHSYGISTIDGIEKFYLPANPNYVSGSIVTNNNINTTNSINVPMRRIKTIMQDLGHKKIDILKMDIEGAEYDVIEDILSSEIAIDQMVIEFHHRMLENGVQRTRKIIELLRKSGYYLFAYSFSKEELSFIKKDETKAYIR